jgi:hypothetical protein
MKKFIIVITALIIALMASNTAVLCLFFETNGQLTMIKELNERLEKNEFANFRQGVCISSDCEFVGGYPNSYSCTTCLVEDFETDKIIEVDVDDTMLYCSIEEGDTICYIVDRNYNDADFLNVIKAS